MAEDYEIARDHDLIYAIHKNAPIEKSPDFLLFMPRKLAMDLANAWDALRHSKTWGEFRSKMPADEYDDYMARSFDDCGKQRPADSEVFSPTDEGWQDGEWPDNPEYWMDTYVPSAVMALGTPIANVFGGSWILTTHEAEALSILREEGYQVERDDDLVKAACGDWWGDG